MTPRGILVRELTNHALVKGEVTLSSGQKAQYYVDVKRAVYRNPGFEALGILVWSEVMRRDATAVGGLTMGADAVAFASLIDNENLKVFLVRKDSKPHGLQRRIEGPPLTPEDRCLVVEDVITTGRSTIMAIDALREEGLNVCEVLAVCDRLAGGREAIERLGVEVVSLTTIDDIYPDRPDR